MKEISKNSVTLSIMYVIVPYFLFVTPTYDVLLID